MKNPIKTLINLSFNEYKKQFKIIVIIQIILISIFLIMVIIQLINLIFDVPGIIKSTLYKFIDKIYFYLIGFSLSISALLIYISNERYKIVKKRIDKYLKNY